MPLELDEPDTAVATAAPARAGWRAALTAKPLGVKERVLFTERLALLLETGVPLHAALQSLHQQSEQPALKAMINAMADDIMGGERFSTALGKHELFPVTYVNLVAASEAGGFLAEVLAQLVEMDEKEERLRSTLVSALSYPLFLTAFSMAVVLFILIFVFPKFSVMFASIYEKLPMTTRALLAVSNLLTQHGAIVGAVVAAVIGACWMMLRRPETRAALDTMKLRAPVLREIFAKIYLTRLLRVMGISLERGVTILATLEACRAVVQNADVQRFILDLEKDVTEGKGIAIGFQNGDFIPVAVRQMIATGEATGTLGRVMTRVADSYDRELTRQLARLSKLAEPVMLMVMGVVVGTIVSSLILPIFKLSSQAH
ncbi:general secretion pathway protein F/type IV pilus assembly protein PilC [Pseudoduganella lurida]|uniref:General secretion pathway protein F/type IV pilus assembly protein PilC n=1 Tax=Pseudoduganella lurida TaxID=1036180 RepID=A0A562RL54_9BURK|nr:type II secretion system F family protein [Pseudoduganella lurida]TWI69751.1 general secretion pathway protein F/type IV pilus assembly protein PilC [Pseudoduganella lurida]